MPSALKRSLDNAFLLSVVNHDDVFPHVSLGLPKPIEHEFLEDEQNVFLANEYGGFLYLWKAPQLYEVHTLFLKPGRGQAVYEAAEKSLDHMFTKTDAMIIATMVPISNSPARKLAEHVGFKKWGGDVINGVEVDMYELSIKDWAMRLDLCL